MQKQQHVRPRFISTNATEEVAAKQLSQTFDTITIDVAMDLHNLLSV